MTEGLQNWAAQVLACPLCRGPVAFEGERISCTSPSCGRIFPVMDGIPAMLPSGTPESESSGFYERIEGGTMEDNPHPGFVAYDSAMRAGFLLKSLAGEAADGPILDVCCSKAPFYRYLADRGFGGRVYGVDMLRHQLKIASGRGVKAAQGNVLALPYRDRFFSAAIFTDALVHLMKAEDRQNAIAEIARVIRPGGVLAMTTTNRSCRGPYRWRTGYDPAASDYCYYIPKAEARELIAPYFSVEAAWPFGFYYLLPSALQYRRGIAVAFDRIMANPLTAWMGMVTFYKLRRK